MKKINVIKLLFLALKFFTVSFLFQNTKQGIQANDIFFTLFAWFITIVEECNI